MKEITERWNEWMVGRIVENKRRMRKGQSRWWVCYWREGMGTN